MHGYLLLCVCVCVSLVVFFSENIVGTVLIFSILIWIPPSLAIHCLCVSCPPPLLLLLLLLHTHPHARTHTIHNHTHTHTHTQHHVIRSSVVQDVRRLKKVREQLEYLEDDYQGNLQEDLMDLALVDQYPDKKAVLTRGLSSLGMEVEARPLYYSLLSDSGSSKRRSSRCSVHHGFRPKSPPISRLQSQWSTTSAQGYENERRLKSQQSTGGMTDWDNFAYKSDS